MLRLARKMLILKNVDFFYKKKIISTKTLILSIYEAIFFFKYNLESAETQLQN
jgi:hypothetical protein